MKTKIIGDQKGFTLIEILVAGAVMAILAAAVMFAINPVEQIRKGEDTKRRAELDSIKSALQLYYNDKNCFPRDLPFEGEWRDGNTVYMKYVPQDEKCNEAENPSCYHYRTDDSECPQWNVLFAKMQVTSSDVSCSIPETSNCAPENYSPNGWICTASGISDC